MGREVVVTLWGEMCKLGVEGLGHPGWGNLWWRWEWEYRQLGLLSRRHDLKKEKETPISKLGYTQSYISTERSILRKKNFVTFRWFRIFGQLRRIWGIRDEA